jgi:hypothetical protein
VNGSDIGLKVSEIRKWISERVLKGRDEGKNVVEECEERMSLVSLLCCEHYLSTGEKRNEFMKDVLFPLSTSLLDIRHCTRRSDETDFSLSHLLSLLHICCQYSTYRSLVCCEEGRLQFGRILSLCNERMLGKTRKRSFKLFHDLFARLGEREIEWMVKEGVVLAAIRRMRDKEERNDSVMLDACSAAAEFLRPDSASIRRVRKKWKGTEEWREVMWMMEEEEGVDHVCAVKEGGGGYWAKEVLRALGICCPT